MTCPYIITSDEGTSYCRLAEESLKRKDAEIAILREALQGMVDATANTTYPDHHVMFAAYPHALRALNRTETTNDR